MERLEKKSSNSVESLIKKLETLIVQDKITDEKLDIIEKALDKIDEELEEPNFQLFELQSIIYYARNNKTKSLEYIEDAISLNSNVKDYSKFGALLAEIYVESSNRAEQSHQAEHITTDKVELEDNREVKKQLEKNKEVKELRKKFNGKIEGWLALYSLRLIAIPFIYLYDITLVLNEDFDSYTSDLKVFFISVVVVEALIVVYGFVLWYHYLKKNKDAIFVAKLLEAGLVVYHFIFGYWLYTLYVNYSVTDYSEITKFVTYGLGAALWFFYWTKSKRVIATFVK